ncbi:MAG: hypothetical protein JW884_03935 [Deltaproteobacteria bacterium]|nr:hypothetical protein [Deltaproteobacteria bacterium]
MKQETEIRFLTDQTLGKLTKWLRILGYDTVSYDGPIDRTFLREGVRERRIVLPVDGTWRSGALQAD